MTISEQLRVAGPTACGPGPPRHARVPTSAPVRCRSTGPRGGRLAGDVAVPEPAVPEINVHLEEKSSAYDRAVPDGLHVAAAWGWRVIVVAIMVAGSRTPWPTSPR